MTGFVNTDSEVILKLPLIGSNGQFGILWDGQTVEVSALKADSGAVLGMALLAGHRVTFDAVDGGSITIIPIP